MMMRKRAARLGAVAVCFQNDRVDVAKVVRPANTAPVVDICTTVRMDGTPVEILSRLRKKYGLDRLPCVTLMVGGEYQLQMMDAPSVPAAEQKSAVRWRLKDVLDYPADSATIDVIHVPTDPGAPTRGRSIYAVAARNERVADRMSAFAQAKLPLKAIDIPEMAQRNVAAMFETPGRALAMLSFTEERGMLTFTSGSQLYLTRSIDVGVTQLRHAEGDLKTQLLDRIVLELQRSLDHFDRQYSYLPLSKLMLAPLPDDIGLRSYLGQSLYIPVEDVQIEQGLDMSRVPDLVSRSLHVNQLLAIGAALREETT